MTKEIEKWWNEVSSGYQKDAQIHTRSAHYGPYAPDENKLKLLGTVRGKKIIEIGCGGGQCSIVFAKQGAKCTGIDISVEQLKFAEKLAKRNKVKVKFVHGIFQDLNQFKSNSYDIVFSAFALLYSSDILSIFKQVYRILKKNGIFVFSLNHPFYDTVNPKTFKIENRYFKTGKHIEIETWPDGTKHKFVMYKRKVSDIFNALVKSKFFVEKIIEPLYVKKQKAWRVKKIWKEIYPEKLVKLIGPTIIFKAKKIK
ncbi:methyltransferase domain-containing protein [candidate division WOR-3 bacterium]|nr:methyltransferase domain-containing protein [candidate division WOR-3 bacterium]